MSNEVGKSREKGKENARSNVAFLRIPSSGPNKYLLVCPIAASHEEKQAPSSPGSLPPLKSMSWTDEVDNQMPAMASRSVSSIGTEPEVTTVSQTRLDERSVNSASPTSSNTPRLDVNSQPEPSCCFSLVQSTSVNGILHIQHEQIDPPAGSSNVWQINLDDSEYLTSFRARYPQISEDTKNDVAENISICSSPMMSSTVSKKGHPPPSRIPRPVKVVPRVVTPLVSSTSTSMESSNGCSTYSTPSEQSIASSDTFSFTNFCSSIASVRSIYSAGSALTFRDRRNSTSSAATIEQGPSLESSLPPLSLPPGATFVSEEEYQDYLYVVYSDKEGNFWGKMCPKILHF
ncbi:hypothetical protein Clacol_008024 [Clathrus columnatus]|uniref:Uncharacterized protein n=1 Tax=Clathrus columnatus TaxID=1419009 RepID=A0AAV5AM46_9AGAM|nr:hypothetical protein Clacol_008024 [Clathrus columnatus]